MSDRPGEMDERDVDERFASIVASWDVRPDDGTGSATDASAPPADGPDAEVTPSERGAAEPDARAPERPPWVNPSPLEGLVPASSWRVVQPPPPAEPGAPTAVVDDDDEHYEPPIVELPPQEDLHFWGAVLGLVAGPLCLVYVAMARPFHSTRWFLAGLALSLGGFALLVLRQPRHRDDEDDGARL